MSDCTCQYDTTRKAYTLVCAFHAPGMSPVGSMFTLAGRTVAADATIEAAPLTTRLPEGALKGYAERVAAVRELDEAIMRPDPPPVLSRAERRRRGQRSVHLPIGFRSTWKRPR